MSEPEGNPLERMVDELELQAWLARAEFRNPSLQRSEVVGEVSALAQVRDELRLQLALGKLEARDEWEVAERKWADVKRLAAATADDAGETMHDLLGRIREGYRELRQRG